MNFDFSDDQKLLQDQVRRYLADHCSSGVVRSVLERRASHAEEVWKGLADMGLIGTSIPESYGGVGAGYLELCLIARELGAALAPVPFGSTVYLLTEALLRYGSEEQKARLLPEIAAGARKGALAVVESREQTTPNAIATRFAGGVLNGRKLIVPDGGIADLLVVLARDGDALGLYLVDLRSAAVERADVTSIDPTRNTASIQLSDTPAEPLGSPGSGWRDLQALYDRAAVLFAFEQLGGAERALEMGVAYARERYAFGRPIGSFQAIKHMLADMYVSAKLAESNCYYAAWALATGSPDLPLAAATARVAATKAYQQCSKDNIQVHGGMGFTWEFDCHLYYRRSNFLALELGGLRVWEDRLVQALKNPAAPSAAAASRSRVMDFSDTPGEAAFRAEARAWIDANAPKHLVPYLERSGFGTVDTGPYDLLEESRNWQRRKAEAGRACLQWPKEHGGRGASPIENVIWNQEEGIYGKLSGLFIIGHGMCGPTMMAYASEEQKRRYLPKLASGEEIWCQLFSEPHGGSDLAGLRTRAEKDGDEWVVNGQKIWTSGAHHSDFGILITRTDPTVPKHKGLTMFFLDMRSPGVDIRPIKQANGQSEFNEVYFDNVRIPDAQRLGGVGDGWRVSLTTLMNERLAIGGGIATGFPDLLELVRTLPLASGTAIDDPAVRAKLADWHVKAAGLRNTAARLITALSKGETPGPEASIGKLVAGTMMQDIAKFALDLQGLGGAITDPEIAEGAARFQAMLLRSPAVRIEGGTDQILRNIIGERVLGLPEDLRADKGIPFSEIPSGGSRH